MHFPQSFGAVALSVSMLVGFGLTAHAQFAPRTVAVKGNFHLAVDDDAVVFLNGTDVHAGKFGYSSSREVELKTGDRLVAQLHNKSAQKWFKLTFLSSDKKQWIEFREGGYKEISDIAQVDFTAEEWAKWNKRPKEFRRASPDGFPFKSDSDWVWGEVEQCALAVLVTNELFKPAPPSRRIDHPKGRK